MSGFRGPDAKDPASLSTDGVRRGRSRDVSWLRYWLVLGVAETVVRPWILSFITVVRCKASPQIRGYYHPRVPGSPLNGPTTSEVIQPP